MAARPGQQIGNYIVDKVLGEGAMATVYAVSHSADGRKHALKVLDITGKEIQERLEREGQVQQALKSANIVGVHEVFEFQKTPVMVMELIEGADLEELLKQQRPTLDEALAIFGGILAGVQVAHAQTITHRDLKPGNVLMHVGGKALTPKIADFGLAKAVGGADGGATETRDGATMGTPRYMAPEQIKDAKTADNRADVFSLGAILYELTTGRLAFDGMGILEIFTAVSSGSYTAPRELVPDLPDNVVHTIEACLKVKPDERPADVNAVAALLYGKTTDFPTSLPVSAGIGAVAAGIWAKRDDAEAEVAAGTFMFDAGTVDEIREAEDEGGDDAEAPAASGDAAIAASGGSSMVKVVLALGVALFLLGGVATVLAVGVGAMLWLM